MYKVFFTGSALKVPSVEDDKILTKFVYLYLIFSGWKVLVIAFGTYMTSYGLRKTLYVPVQRLRQSENLPVWPQPTNQPTDQHTNQPTHCLSAQDVAIKAYNKNH